MNNYEYRSNIRTEIFQRSLTRKIAPFVGILVLGWTLWMVSLIIAFPQLVTPVVITLN